MDARSRGPLPTLALYEEGISRLEELQNPALKLGNPAACVAGLDAWSFFVNPTFKPELSVAEFPNNRLGEEWLAVMLAEGILAEARL